MQPSFTTDRLLNQEGGGGRIGLDLGLYFIVQLMPVFEEINV
jgi:hypothetical protein